MISHSYIVVIDHTPTCMWSWARLAAIKSRTTIHIKGAIGREKNWLCLRNGTYASIDHKYTYNIFWWKLSPPYHLMKNSEKYTPAWFQIMAQHSLAMNALLLEIWDIYHWKLQTPHHIIFYIYLTCTSNVKYFFKFLMIITRKGSLIPRVFFGSAGHVMNVVLQ